MRNCARPAKQRSYPLYSADSESTCRVVRHRVSLDEAEKFEALGVWERRYDTYSGELMGFRIVGGRDDSDKLSAGWTPAAISPDEMELNCERSATVGLPEVLRLKREKEGRSAEDHIERVQCKVRVWAIVGASKKDILRAWPK
jgi:hypothetical protein